MFSSLWNSKALFALIICILSGGLVLLSGCALFSSPAEPPPSTVPTQPPVISEYAAPLAERFCPVLYFKGEGEVVENYDPEPIEIMVDEALVRDIEDPSFSEKATLASLLQWSTSAYYLDLAGLGLSVQSFDEYKLKYEELREQYQPTVYARVKEGGETAYTVVQYWIFYYFNDWRNYHEGDWELVQLNFQGRSAQEILESGAEPLFAAYSQHQGGQRLSWSEMKDMSFISEETHPVVYVARGSHANYFTPGNFWSLLDFDDTGLSSWQIISPEQLNIVMLPEAEVSGLDWLGFRGYWGEYVGFSISLFDLKFWQHGPFGPPWSEGEQMNQKWAHPDEWADGLSEFPSPFWTSFIKLLGDWTRLAIFSLFSPADLHVYDAMGRHVGYDEQGIIEKDIPGAIYIKPEGTNYKIILIPDADIVEGYSIVAKGVESGTMDIKAQVPDVRTDLCRFLEYTGVPVTPTTTARANISPAVPAMMMAPALAEVQGVVTRDTTTMLEIDNDGDGVFEIASSPGKFEVEEMPPEPVRPPNNERAEK